MPVVYSIHKIPIRLSLERWQHIATNHPELANHKTSILRAVAEPDIIFKGKHEEFLAAKHNSHWLIVVYKESQIDGFIITAFITSRIAYLLTKEVIWQKPSSVK